MSEGSPDDYETVCELGRGAFAVVRKVVHRDSGVEYAMKVMEKRKLLRNSGMGGPSGGAMKREQYAELQNKVLSEARILRTVDHPNVIRFIDIFEDDVHLYLVMELVEGGELFEQLVEHGPFAEPDARAIMHQLLQALGHLHERHIVHRECAHTAEPPPAPARRSPLSEPARCSPLPAAHASCPRVALVMPQSQAGEHPPAAAAQRRSLDVAGHQDC